MEKTNLINFNGENYFDDRLFVLYLCPGKVEVNADTVSTIIYHDKELENCVWCVVTYRNCARYPVYRVDSFYKKRDAEEYIKKIEPETPLISLKGFSPNNIMSYNEYMNWKKEKNLKEYNWKELYSIGGENFSEHFLQTKESFKGIN